MEREMRHCCIVQYKMTIKHVCSFTVVNKSGCTPLHIVSSRCHQGVFPSLEVLVF